METSACTRGLWDISLHSSAGNYHTCLDGHHVHRVQGLCFPGGNSCRRHIADKSRPAQLGQAVNAGNLVNIPSAALPIAVINPRSLCYQLRWRQIPLFQHECDWTVTPICTQILTHASIISKCRMQWMLKPDFHTKVSKAWLFPYHTTPLCPIAPQGRKI